MKETSNTLIGVFVMGAITLCVSGILVFGSGDFFKKSERFVLFFEESVKGLTIGAPVLFRGVEIGKVTEISLYAKISTMETLTPVVIETDPGRWVIEDDLIESSKTNIVVRTLIDKGMRARLVMQSMVTGKYVIQLDYHPDEPAVFVGKPYKYPELPTIKTEFSMLSEKIARLPIENVFQRINSIVGRIDAMLGNEEISSIVLQVHKIAEQTNQLLNELNKQIIPMTTEYTELARTTKQNVAVLGGKLGKTVDQYRHLAQQIDTQVKPLVSDYRSVAQNLNKEVEPLAKQIRQATDAIRSGMMGAQRAFESARDLVSHDSPVIVELAQALEELSSASRSIRVFADYIEQHPEALIQGKGSYRR